MSRIAVVAVAAVLVAGGGRPAAADEDPWLSPTVVTTWLGPLRGGQIGAETWSESAGSGYLRWRVGLTWAPVRGQPVTTVIFEGYCMTVSLQRVGDAIRLRDQCGRFDDDTGETDHRLRDGRWRPGPRRVHSPYVRHAAGIIRQLARGKLAEAAAERELIGDTSSGHDELTDWWDELFRRARAGERRTLLAAAPRLLAPDHPRLAVHLRRELR